VAYRNAGGVNGFPLDHNCNFHEQVQPVADIERQVVVVERHRNRLPHPERAPAELVFEAAAKKSLDTKDTKDTKENQDKCEHTRRQDAKERERRTHPSEYESPGKVPNL
jgi:hypothetical protein